MPTSKGNIFLNKIYSPFFITSVGFFILFLYPYNMLPRISQSDTQPKNLLILGNGMMYVHFLRSMATFQQLIKYILIKDLTIISFKLITLITTMKISNLCQNRLQISINSLRNNPAIPDCLSQTLYQIFESLNENILNVEFIQSQLIHKVSSTQFNYGIAQKLSMVEFLQYFGKVEKIMESIERNQKYQHQRLERVVEEQNNKIANIDQIVQSITRDWDRKKKSQQLQQETLKAQLKDFKKKLERLKTEQEKQQTSLNRQFNMLKIAQQFKDLEQCCSDMKINIDQLVKDFKFTVQQTKRSSLVQSITHPNQNKFVTFDELREVLSELERSLTTSIGNYLSDVDKNKLQPSNSLSRKNYTQSSDNDFSFHSITNSHINHTNYWLHNNSNEILLTPTFNPNHYNMKQSIQLLPQPQASNTISPSLTVQWTSQLSKNTHHDKKSSHEVIFNRPNSCKNVVFSQKVINKNIQPADLSKNSTKPQSLNSSQTFNLQNYSKYIFEVNSQCIVLKEKGYYQIKCGFLPLYPSELILLSNQQVIASHVFTETPRKYICRAIMMYIQVDQQGQQIRICCSPLDQTDKKYHQQTMHSKSGSKRKNRLDSQNIDVSQICKGYKIKGFLCIKKLT